ncbi:hypothetical protein GJ699_03450 [Duganella sp. FT80W]|uniref:Uncharacterized protein n=1 Tax=Duganella guangzhouensis TaxID=2666084 RepID=A0A6I2KUA1_9BURK|nr:hypothetical protein [Duganella guangzhouensis]MRW89032.1 hypothetical protein [Duganella guangzhouensis]
MIISAEMGKCKYALAEHPELRIGGRSLEIVISEFANDPDIAGLAPAHSWLHNKAELSLAWERLLSFNIEQLVTVPLLICPDDMDLNCTVLLAEQHCVEGAFVWTRFGYALDRELNDVNWLQTVPPFQFVRANFVDEVFKYADLCEWPLEY